jgi:hypothetical protein
MILSDLDVHLEQTDGQARYFGVDDPTALADHLAAAWAGRGPAIARDLLPNVGERMQAFAMAFVRLVRSAHAQRRAKAASL